MQIRLESQHPDTQHPTLSLQDSTLYNVPPQLPTFELNSQLPTAHIITKMHARQQYYSGGRVRGEYGGVNSRQPLDPEEEDDSYDEPYDSQRHEEEEQQEYDEEQEEEYEDE